MLNNVADVLSVVLKGSLGRSGRKRARRASKFLTGHRGFLGTSALIGAAGVAWGIYDTLRAKNQGAVLVPGVPTVPGVPQVPPIPAAIEAAFDPVARIIRLAVQSEFHTALTRQQTLEVSRLVTDWHGQGPIHLPGIRVTREGRRLVFVAA